MISLNIMSGNSLSVSMTSLLELKEYVCKHKCIRVVPIGFIGFEINGRVHRTIKIALRK